MAYDKYTWQTGEVITAEKLNHIEDGIANMEGGDAGYECTETVTELFDETVTTVSQSSFISASLSYSAPIDTDVLTVFFDGVEYTCPKIEMFGSVFYGGFASQGPVFTEYPFCIQSDNGNGNTLYTENAGEYTVKATMNITTVTTTDCFNKAVQSVETSTGTVFAKFSTDRADSELSENAVTYNSAYSGKELSDLVGNGANVVGKITGTASVGNSTYNSVFGGVVLSQGSPEGFAFTFLHFYTDTIVSVYRITINWNAPTVKAFSAKRINLS